MVLGVPILKHFRVNYKGVIVADDPASSSLALPPPGQHWSITHRMEVFLTDQPTLILMPDYIVKYMFSFNLDTII